MKYNNLYNYSQPSVRALLILCTIVQGCGRSLEISELKMMGGNGKKDTVKSLHESTEVSTKKDNGEQVPNQEKNGNNVGTGVYEIYTKLDATDFEPIDTVRNTKDSEADAKEYKEEPWKIFRISQQEYEGQIKALNDMSAEEKIASELGMNVAEYRALLAAQQVYDSSMY